MSLEEEVMIVEFAQGIRSEDDLFDHFRQLNDDDKTDRIFDMTRLIGELEPTNFEIEQASANMPTRSAGPVEIGVYFPRKKRLTQVSLRIDLANDVLEKSYLTLLKLFKATYQRQFVLERKNAVDWWFQDLADNNAVANILTNHRALVEEIYQHPGFRGEFASIAKLHQASQMLRAAKVQNAQSSASGTYHFVRYEEIVTASIEDNKYNYAAFMLSGSVMRALSKRYHLKPFRAVQVMQEVVGRYTRELDEPGETG
ncbi:DUF5958 family protein [Larkinella arboricola]